MRNKIKISAFAFAALVLFELAFSVGVAFGWTPRIAATKFSPDGKWKIELADFNSQTRFELFSTFLASGTRTKIGGTVPFDNDVDGDFVISSDSSRVSYRQGRTATGDWRLYSTPISSASAVELSQRIMVLGGGVDTGIRVVEDGRTVRYRADPEVDESFAFYRVRDTGGPIRKELLVAGFEHGNFGEWSAVVP